MQIFTPSSNLNPKNVVCTSCLALITEVDMDNRMCKAFYIPRLNLDGKRKMKSQGRRKVWPQQALFDPIVAWSTGEGGRISVVDHQ
jgi:hypothetical protein